MGNNNSVFGGCYLTQICNVTKNGENDGILVWNILLEKNVIEEIETNYQYCYKVYKIDDCEDPIEVNSGEITYENCIDSDLDIVQVKVENLSAGHFKLDIFLKNNGQVDKEDIEINKFIYSSCSGYVREPDQLQMIISNNKQTCCCKSKADLTIIGGVAPYTVYVNQIDVSESYSSICLFNCKVNKIKVSDANGCEICRKI